MCGLTRRNRVDAAISEVDAELDDPRTKGRGLTGSLSGLWRYRIGDYRVICDIRDREAVILLVEMGRRDAICR